MADDKLTEKKMTAIRVDTLRGDLQIPFDAYIRIGEKFVLYCRQGSSFEGERLDRLKAKKLKKMYVRKEDEIPYRQYLEQSIDAAYANKDNKTIELRAEVIQGFQQAAAEEYMEDPLNQFSYNHVRSSVQRFTEFLQKEPDGVRAIMTLRNINHSITHHSVAVAALSVAMAQEAQVVQVAQLPIMTLGCLLHDIEHFYTEFPLNRPLGSLDPAEQMIYKEHPSSGGHRLQGAKFIDQLALKIITQHEEHIDGSGFPSGLFERDMDPLVVIVGAANAFERLVSFEGMSRKDALKYLLIEKMGMYPLPHLQNLQKILKKHGLV